MNETQPSIEEISLLAQLEAIQAALEMHIIRSERLALQASRLQTEIETLRQEEIK